MTEEQEKKYPFAKDVVEILNSYEDEELLENLEDYVMEACSYSAEMLNKEILLGEISLMSPSEWDDWTDDEKIRLFDRWDIVDRLIALSKVEMLRTQEKEEEEEDSEEDPNKNNGKGMVC